MDTGLDFIQPEFLNILFFQQKNLVIFPYVDLKHLHSLEVFSVGHNLTEIDSTAMHNLVEILTFESSNTYSQTPSLYLIYNIDKARLEEIMKINTIRFILNSNENIQTLANGANFVFYNKKNNRFINYEEPDLEFERELIKSSKNISILQDKIQEIKSKATQIFTEINEGNEKNIPGILSGYEYKYWDKILHFVDRYYDTPAVPKAEDLKPQSSNKKAKNVLEYLRENGGIPIELAQEALKLTNEKEKIQKKQNKLESFSPEYNLIKNTNNKPIISEFIQLLNEYRKNHVNQSNLELKQLYSPQDTYDYLRNHHWSDGIPDEFVQRWVKMECTGHQLTKGDYEDFEFIFKKLGVSEDVFSNIFDLSEDIAEQNSPMPSVENFSEFKAWVLDMLNKIEKKIS